MKKYIIALFVMCVMIAGCKKDLNYNYAFSLNGVSERGDNYTAFYHYDTVGGLQQFAADFYIGNVTDTNYVQISCSGNQYIAAGIYYTGIINPGNTTCSFAYNNKHTYYTNVSGILEILQIDTVLHTLKGNFQFRAVNTVNLADSVTVANGGFSGIKYLIQ